MMEISEALDRGYVNAKIEVDVLIHPETGNILYPCDGCKTKAFDRYGIISDPAVDESKAVNLLCSEHKKRYMRSFVPPTLEGMIAKGLRILIEDKWTALSVTKIKQLKTKYGWFAWLLNEDSV